MAITMIAIKSSITANADRNAFIACDTRFTKHHNEQPIAKAISVAVGIPNHAYILVQIPAIKK